MLKSGSLIFKFDLNYLIFKIIFSIWQYFSKYNIEIIIYWYQN